MNDSKKKKEPSIAIQEDDTAAPDLERASSSRNVASTSVVANESSSFVPAVVISEKEDPISDHGNVPVITAHQVVNDGPDSHRPSSATKGTIKADGNIASINKDASATPQAVRVQRKNRKGIMLCICFCLLAVIGIIVALAVTLSSGEDDQDESRDASFLTNRLTESPSDAPSVVTPVPTSTPTISTPVPSFSPSYNPTDHPTVNKKFCLEGSDACGDAPGLFGFGLGTDWRSLSCEANISAGGFLKCTIVACNQVFPFATPLRVLYLVSPNTNQRIELYSNGFELFDNNNDFVYSGNPNIRSGKIVDIELPIAYFPNLEDIQVWLESSVMRPFAPVDRLPNQITLSFSPC